MDAHCAAIHSAEQQNNRHMSNVDTFFSYRKALRLILRHYA
jgi:hypothetical protein